MSSLAIRWFSSRALLGILSVVCLAHSEVSAQSSTTPEEGIQSRATRATLFRHAHIVISPERNLPEGDLLVRDGKIIEIGPSITAPVDAQIIECEGKYLYPAFIDPLVEQSVPSAERPDAHWNRHIQPQRQAYTVLASDDKLAAQYRRAGFGAMLIAPSDGIIKGSSAVVSTAKLPVARTLLRNSAFQHMTLVLGRSERGGYPNSPMGVVALTRQTLSDAQWYQQAQQAFRADPSLPAPDKNVALEALAGLIRGEQAAIFDSGNELYALRADRMAREFALRAVIRGSGREYRRLDSIVDSGRTFILPVDFPKPPEVTSLDAASVVTLQTLMHWYLAPENPGRLDAANVNFVLTASGLSSPNELLENVRKAISRGLSEEAALSALTARTAKLLEIDHLVGSLERGKLANLLLTTGPIWEKKTTIEETWVQGERYRWQERAEFDPSGRWKLKLTGADGLSLDELDLQLDSMTEKPKGQLALPGELAKTDASGSAKESQSNRGKPKPDEKSSDHAGEDKEAPRPTDKSQKPIELKDPAGDNPPTDDTKPVKPTAPPLPTEPKPTEAESKQPTPKEAQPEEAKPDEAKLEQVKPDQAKPDQTKPDEAKPDDAQPDDTKPDDAKPDEAKPDNAKPDNAKPDDAKPDDAKAEAGRSSTEKSTEEPTKSDKAQHNSELKQLSLSDFRVEALFDAKKLIEKQKGSGRLSLTLLIEGTEIRSVIGRIQWPGGEVSQVNGTPVTDAAEEKPQDKASDAKVDDAKPNDVKTSKAKTNEAKQNESKPENAKPADEEGKKIAGGSEADKRVCDVNYPLGAFGLTTPPEQAEWILVKDATVWTADEQGILEGGDLLIHRGIIKEVGQELEAPEGAMVIDAQGKHVSPGIIDCHSHMATDGGVNESGQAVTAEVRIGDFIDPNDMNIYWQLAGGVTTANVLHGSANPIGGQNQVIKLRWGANDEAMKMREAPPGIKFALGENVKQSNWGERASGRYPQTRMGVEQIMRDRFEAAKLYRAARTAGGTTGKSLPPRRDYELDAIVEILDHKRWIHCHSYRQDEILAFLRVLEDYDITVGSLQHILEGYKVAEAMARHGATGSTFSDWWAYKFEVLDAIPYNGALMHRAGIIVSFNSDDDELARHLNHEAAKAIKYGGLTPEEALKFVTLNPAKQLRIDQYVGSLAVGKQADFVIWRGSPLSTLSRCEQTWIEGRKYFDREQDAANRLEAERLRRELVQRILDSGEKTAGDGRDRRDPSLWFARYDEFCNHAGHNHDDDDHLHRDHQQASSESVEHAEEMHAAEIHAKEVQSATER